MASLAYIAIALALIAFGYLSLFSVGAPFLLTGVAMLIVLPWRRRPHVLVPALVAPWAFALGYVLVAPLGCTATAAPNDGFVGVTRCDGVFFDYVGGASYSPPLAPALLTGFLVAGLVVFAAHRAVLRSR